MDKMLQKLMEQEKRLVAEQLAQCQDVEIKLSPKIDVDELLRNGYIIADEYEKSHHI